MHSSNFVFSLAKFKNEADTTVIKDFITKNEFDYKSFRAIIEFPHSSFYPLITKSWIKELESPHKSRRHTLRVKCQALAKYDIINTVELFKKALNLKSKYKRKTLKKYIFLAINKYPSYAVNYSGLSRSIKLDKYTLRTIIEEMNND